MSDDPLAPTTEEGVAPGHWLLRERDDLTLFLFFLAAVFLFVYPILHADHLYWDDNSRALLAGDGLKAHGATFRSWTPEGRPLTYWLFNVLTFTTGHPDTAPLPLLLTTVALALALRRVHRTWAEERHFASALVWLPLALCPFLLQNLSYQYDCLATALGMLACVYAVTHPSTARLPGVVLPVLLLAAACAFYQPCLNYFVGLCCLECVRRHRPGVPSRALSRAGRHLMVLTGAVLLYALCVRSSLTSERTALVSLSPSGLDTVIANAREALTTSALLLQGAGAWVFGPLLGLAVLGWLHLLLESRSDLLRSRQARGDVLALLLSVPVALLAIAGMTIVLSRGFSTDVRVLLGVPPFLAMLFCLASRLLRRLALRADALLLVPLGFMLSTAYQYGRTLAAHKDYEQAVAHSLFDAVNRLPPLTRAGFLVIHQAVSPQDAVPGAIGAFLKAPLLKKLNNIYYTMLPGTLGRVGLLNVVSSDDTSAESMNRHIRTGAYKTAPPLIDGPFYKVYVYDGNAYIDVLPSPQLNSWREGDCCQVTGLSPGKPLTPATPP